MSQIYKVSIGRLFSKSKIPRIINSFTSRRHVILNFHRVYSKQSSKEPFDTCPSVRSDLFREILRYFQKHYTVVSLKNLCENLDSTRPLAAITFDDGWRDNYDIGFPILRELGLTAAVFVTTGKIGSSEPFWQQKLGEAFRLHANEKDKKKQNGYRKLISLKDKEPLNIATYWKTVEKLKSMSRSNLRTKLSLVSPSKRQHVGPRLFLCEKEIQEMSEYGIAFGSHTVNHVILTQEPQHVARSELEESKRALEEIAGKRVDMISYPNGSFSREIIHEARSLGFKIGFATKCNFAGEKDDLMKLPRIDLDWDQMGDEHGGFSAYMFEWSVLRNQF